MRNAEFAIDNPEYSGMRVDRYVAEVLELFSRSQLKSRDISVAVNGKEAKWSHRVAAGDRIVVAWEAEVRTEITPEPIDIDVVYESDEVVVVNKPQGMVVHPAAGNYTGTLVQGLAYRHLLGDRLSADNPRPGIVHRLDKDTSGVLITAKSPLARQFLANQFAKKHTRKVYLAVVKGMVLPRSGRIETMICRDPKNRKRFTTSDVEGKPAVTDYRVLRQFDDHAFVALLPLTGRTHQLRVHMSSVRHPIVGDPIYSRPDVRFPEATLMLHAHRLTIMLPRKVTDAQSPEGYHLEGGETAEFRAPLPQRFKLLLRELSKGALGADTRGRPGAR